MPDGSDPGPALALRGVRFGWGRSEGFTLSVPDFAVARGERVLLTGPSGSGKSTLLGLVAGITLPAAGEVAVDGVVISALSGPARDRFRAERIGVVFQLFNLLPYASGLDNILLALAFAPARRSRAGRDARAAALRLGAALGLSAGLLARPAATLSVGQQQRVAVARALIGAPALVIADEPTSALDPAARDAFLALLFAQLAEAGATLLMVSHDEALGARFDRVAPLASLAGPAGATGPAMPAARRDGPSA